MHGAVVMLHTCVCRYCSPCHNT